ncbi:hypothetical protein NTH_04510 (plasmid) [Nitratireductor thuwali]|uniref:Uncharacterized protein n=1 Tax=Nitratireductor thuwali TaxID=2267699 RepID=A0ABY5MPZ9_9HYPH|nr:hypothetical protein NTH_04510 [Nitratireductor thuwali]
MSHQPGPPLSRYISNNADLIPIYAERHRYGEVIWTAFVESTVNQVIAKRLAKKQQMQWTPRGVHLLMQLRTRVLDGTLDSDFKRWREERRPANQAYPAFGPPATNAPHNLVLPPIGPLTQFRP